MIDLLEHWPLFLYLATFSIILPKVISHYDRVQSQKRHGCQSIPRYPQWDVFLGSDVAFSMAKALKNHGFLNWLRELHVKARAKTFTLNFLGTRVIHSIEPENMKALSATVWKDFGIEPLRRTNKASMPFADKGVNTTDGHMWEYSRFLIKPYFVREAFSNTDRLEQHTDRLLSLIPRDGSTVDIQGLLQRWFLDTSTDFLFGESMLSLKYPERAEIAWAMTDVLRYVRLRLQMSKCLFLFRSQKWLDAVAKVHTYMDHHIDKTLKEMQPQGKDGPIAEGVSPSDEDRSDLLWSMANILKADRELLRSQMLLLFVPNNDTTSIFISNVFWNLARHPDVYAKVRNEVLSVGLETKLTYEVLRAMKYLNAVLNETHRLYPNGVTQVRTALKDSSLPLGGGPDGKSPIFVRKGDIVQINKSVMHRDKDVWGEDADEYNPDRWENLRPYWNFVPFGGGPRRCPAQLLVTTEASYTIARFARCFKAIDNRDPKPYVPVMRVGPVNINGVKISVTPA